MADIFDTITGFYRRRGRSSSGIVYCRYKKTCDEIASYLRGRGVHARPYHRGVPFVMPNTYTVIDTDKGLFCFVGQRRLRRHCKNGQKARVWTWSVVLFSTFISTYRFQGCCHDCIWVRDRQGRRSVRKQWFNEDTRLKESNSYIIHYDLPKSFEGKVLTLKR